MSIRDHPELTTAYNFYGEDGSAVGALVTGPLLDRLMSQPGVILEAEGPWLIATFHVGLAFGNSDDRDDHTRVRPAITRAGGPPRRAGL